MVPQCGHDFASCVTGDVAQMVERSLSMREGLGSMPSFSILDSGNEKQRNWHENEIFCEFRFCLYAKMVPHAQDAQVPQTGIEVVVHPHKIQQKWTHWGLNPGPSACEADVIPLHHVPHEI